MKIKGKYLLREINGMNIAVPIIDTVLTSNVIIILNDTAVFLWKLLETGCTKADLVKSLCEEYDTDAKTASEDVQMFIEYLKENKVSFE
ncbi:MAG: PqqD family protein [Clostridia bacterium]|nr:PqqD family protein [Clostridia bacterium]